MSYKDYKKIDCHAHPVPKFYNDAMEKYLGGNPDKFPMPQWSVDLQLEFMEKMNVCFTVNSFSSPHINMSTREVNRDLARQANELCYDVVKKYPSKFGYLGTLPVPQMEDTLAEINHAVKNLGAWGFTLPTNTKGTYMGDPSLEPMWDEFNKLGIVVAFHPNKPSAVPEIPGSKLPFPMMEFFFDTTRTVVDLILKGYMTRYPNVKIMLPHCGAMLPYVVDRLNSFKPVLIRTGTVAEDFDVYAEYKKFWFDSGGSSGLRQIPDVMEVVDHSRFVFATDWPFTPVPVIAGQADAIFANPVYPEEFKRKIALENALKLFPQIKL